MADIKKDGSEILHYDNPDFQVYIRKNHILYNEKFSDISLHWHDELEFIYVLEGDIGYLVDGERLMIKAGEGIFVNSRHLHLIRNGIHNCVLLCIIFPPMLLCTSKYVAGKMVEPILQGNMPYLFLDGKIDWQKRALDCLQAIYDSSLEQGNEVQILSLAYQLWHEIAAHTEPDESGEAAEKSCGNSLSDMKKLIRYIEDHYQKKLTLLEMCRHTGVGKNKCTELFRKYTNLSPMQYLNHYRLEKGIEQLKNTDMSITEIAYAVGFNGASYFTESIRNYTGYSARKLRALEREKHERKENRP